MSGMSAIGGMQAGAMRGTFQPPSFDSLDTDSDDSITLDEMKSSAPNGVSSTESDARAEEMFSQMDADGDGKVSQDEKSDFDSQMESRMAMMSFSAQVMGSKPPDAASILSALDSDGDETVSIEEFSSSDAVQGLDDEQVEELYSAIDEDGDGAVTEAEIESYFEQMKPAEGAKGPPPPPPPPPSESGGATGQTESGVSAEILSMITNALEAYQSSGSSEDDLTDSLFGVLDEAA